MPETDAREGEDAPPPADNEAEEVLSNDDLTRQMLEVTLGLLRRRVAGEVPEDADPNARLVAELRDFTRSWNLRVEGFAAGASVGKEPDVSGAFVISQKRFFAATRISGEATGIAAGRVPGLEWSTHWNDAAPAELRKALSEIRPYGVSEHFESASLPFAREKARLWHVWFPAEKSSGVREADAFAITSDESDVVYLDWLNEKIYDLADRSIFRPARDPFAYIKCFFHLVRGTLGRFTILENSEDADGLIPWLETASKEDREAQRAKILGHVMPMTRGGFNDQGEAIFRATVLFKNAVFRTDVLMDQSGILRLDNEAALEEDLAINPDSGLMRQDDTDAA